MPGSPSAPDLPPSGRARRAAVWILRAADAAFLALAVAVVALWRATGADLPHGGLLLLPGAGLAGLAGLAGVALLRMYLEQWERLQEIRRLGRFMVRSAVADQALAEDAA